MQSSMIKSITEDFGNGGTIDGDLTISGDLQVSGGGSLSFDEIVQGTQVIDVTNTEALLVRKNDDGGDVFVVDTTNSRVGIGTSSPSVPLHVYHGTSNGVALFESGDASGGIALKDNSTSNNVFLLATGDNFGIQTGGVANRLVIDGSGDATFSGSLGVGASPVSSFPAQNVTIEGATAGLVLRDSTGSNQATQFFTLYSSNGDIIGMFDDSKSLKFGHADDAVGTNYTDVLVIKSDNRVGIGTSSVNGVFTAQGTPMTAVGAQTVADIFGNVQQDADKGGGIGLGGRYITDSNSVTAFAEISGVKANNTSANYEGEMVFKTRVNGGNLTERMRIDGSGNVGIGRTPTQKLDIYASSGNQTIMNELGGGGNAELRLKNNAGDRIIRASSDKLQFIDNADSRADLTIDGSGNIGIGTGSPDTKLDIVGSDFAGASLKIERTGDGENDDSAIRLNRTGTVDANDRIGGIYFQDNDTSLALIRGEKIGTNDGRLDFIVPNGSVLSNTTNPVLTIQNDNVGIGTASPTSKLSVSAGRGANTGLEILDSADSNNKRIDLRLDADGDGYLSLVDASETTKVQLYSNGVSYFNGGNVGIGRSTNIDKKLHILSSTSGDGMTLEQSSTGSNTIRFEANSSALRGLFGSEDSDGGAILSGSTGYSMVLRSESDIFLATNGNNEALKIDTSQNATFGGNVKITKAESSASEFISALEINRDYGSATSTDLLTGMIFTDDNSVQAGIFTNRYNSAGNYNSRLQFYVNNSSSSMTPQTALGDPALTINESKNATFAGDVTVNGALSKGSGSFKIDHPLQSKKETHHLVHSFVEAPQADNIYRGKVTLSSGSVEINLDTVSGMSEGTFVLLNTDIQCFTSNESDWDAVKGSVNKNILTISCQNTDSTANVSWLVIGERQDDHMKETNWTDENGKVIVEPVKIINE